MVIVVTVVTVLVVMVIVGGVLKNGNLYLQMVVPRSTLLQTAPRNRLSFCTPWRSNRDMLLISSRDAIHRLLEGDSATMLEARAATKRPS